LIGEEKRKARPAHAVEVMERALVALSVLLPPADAESPVEFDTEAVRALAYAVSAAAQAHDELNSYYRSRDRDRAFANSLVGAMDESASPEQNQDVAWIRERVRTIATRLSRGEDGPVDEGEDELA
jgi:hypothetical protein